MSVDFTLSAEERNMLGTTARRSIAGGFEGASPVNGLTPPPDGVLTRHLGSFVTLTMGGVLRGCIGTILPHEPLYSNVARMAHAAAFQDPRFPPLRREEWERTHLEISVLSPMLPCPDPERIEIGRHGLLLRLGRHSGVFLPKVPVEQGWDRPAYLENLCRKAGLPAGSWKHPDAQFFWYEALAFSA